VRALATLLVGTLQAIRILRRLHPHLVIGTGGYVMGPAVLAATLLRVPRVIMEQNLLPGLTVRVLARCAHRVFTTFPETQTYLRARGVQCTGTPIRPGIGVSFLTDEAEPNGVLHVLVFGGSQGAHRINQAMLEALPFFKQHEQQLRIVHQTGERDFATVAQAYQQAALDVEVSPFLHDMDARYRWAHLVVCRAGASTLAELTACGKPSILVPYPYAANDHQRLNALALQRQGAAQVILDAELTGARLAAALHAVLTHTVSLRQQAEQSRNLGKPQAADAIVTACLHLVGQTS
jgi:UDP-N-acetylglucosamine--N-acetylmuramyl-(pentapeptide) pyrophosphoryl-undecaprenol N-acetylglucosamine transferase